MTRHYHRILAAVAVVLLLCVLASSALLAREAAHPHACAGNDCPICQFIERAEQLRRALGTALVALLLASFALSVARNWRDLAEAAAPVLNTLVDRKIRLND